MKKLVMVLLLSATVAFAKNPTSESKAHIKDTDPNGVPTFITGELGELGPGDSKKAAKDFLVAQRGLLGGAGTEDFEAIGSTKDNFGHTHVRLQQRLRGLPVYGAEYLVHADGNGKVYAINGRFAPDRDLPRNPSINGWSALERAASQAGAVNGRWNNVKAELVYVATEKGSAYLAWRGTIEYVNEEGEQVDILYADATSGDLVLRAPQIHRARNRATYNGNSTSTLPGTLVLTETGGSTTDSVISTAHAHAATSYDYYMSVHSRDSFNNAGAQIKTTVHHQLNYNNAFWNGSQLVYGDGDGSQFSPLGNALDVGAHELSHAVTTYSANLTYSYESGALNEGTSDIMAAAVEAWKDGAVSADTWKVGEDVTTPGTAGDALRYMNDPIADGSSYDYYPTRYTGSGDYGGVHLNSGIANLAFKLWVTGGTHPRGKTTVNVPALNATAMTSINMGAKIWYRALTVYMTSSTNFQGARTATAQAATDLYGAAAADSVHKGWDAVGVPGTPGGGGGGTTTLTNGVAVTNIGASTGAWKHYKISVPSGQSKLEIIQSGGTGDADLYVRLGAQPTSSSYNYRPYLNGNNETVTVTNPSAGDWYISIYAYSTYSGVSLKATYSTTTSGCTNATGSLSGTGANWYSAQYASSVSGAHTGKLTGPSGTDFDLYLQKWNGASWASVAAGESATSIENVTYNGTSGTYRWRVYAYSGSGSFTLCTTKP
ncbi:MAG TPA: M4 family metallopeptidase [Thermoanaerobaculia bacterium]|nr:M4 family metallopeptidase [Thermoanaerobaculia bacterium]